MGSRPTESAVERSGCSQIWTGHTKLASFSKWDDFRLQEGKDMSEPPDWLGTQTTLEASWSMMEPNN